MQLDDIGELIDQQTHWHLVYAQCGHVQDFARDGFEDAERAAREVRQHYARCLSCLLDVRLPKPSRAGEARRRQREERDDPGPSACAQSG